MKAACHLFFYLPADAGALFAGSDEIVQYTGNVPDLLLLPSFYLIFRSFGLDIGASHTMSVCTLSRMGRFFEEGLGEVSVPRFSCFLFHLCAFSSGNSTP